MAQACKFAPGIYFSALIATVESQEMSGPRQSEGMGNSSTFYFFHGLAHI